MEDFNSPDDARILEMELFKAEDRRFADSIRDIVSWIMDFVLILTCSPLDIFFILLAIFLRGVETFRDMIMVATRKTNINMVEVSIVRRISARLKLPTSWSGFPAKAIPQILSLGPNGI